MFAQKIRELRMARNLSEAALDEIFGLMRGTVANWEHGYAVPEDELIDDIESELRNMPRGELTSKNLGTKVLERLEKLDDVAYVRFASVYKDFKNIEEFASALEEIR